MVIGAPCYSIKKCIMLSGCVYGERTLCKQNVFYGVYGERTLCKQKVFSLGVNMVRCTLDHQLVVSGSEQLLSRFHLIVICWHNVHVDKVIN